MEVWKCKKFTLQLNHEVRTLQLDMMEGIKVNFAKLSFMGSIIWNQLRTTQVTFRDQKKHDFKTGFEEMKKLFPDSHFDTDQFIIRFHQGKILEERCVRLKNGYLSTEREAVEWDKRNNVTKDRYVKDFLKEAGIHLKKVPGSTTDPKPNEKCPCGSGKKFKRCCQGKEKVTGVVGDLTYKK